MPNTLTVGWVYNLDNPNATTSAPRLVAVALVFSTLATLAVALRFWIRTKSVAGIGADDFAGQFQIFEKPKIRSIHTNKLLAVLLSAVRQILYDTTPAQQRSDQF